MTAITAILDIRHANFDSVIKSQLMYNFISLKSSWNHPIFAAKCFYKNNLVHKKPKVCPKNPAKKKIIF